MKKAAIILLTVALVSSFAGVSALAAEEPSGGWLQTNGGWYYEKADGTQAADEILTIDGADYMFADDGHMYTGWIDIGDGNYYYADDSGALAYDKWQKSGPSWYYLKEDGLMARDELLVIDGVNCQFDAAGVCANGQNVSGSGDDVITGVTLESGIFRVHFKHDGSRNFIVESYDDTGDTSLLVNTIGAYDGYVLLEGTSPYAFEITADGSWTYTIEQLTDAKQDDAHIVFAEDGSAVSFTGVGDYVTDIWAGSSGAWQFTHDGDRNFAIWLYTADGRDLLVNEIGAYDGKKMVSIPTGSKAFFEIHASGNWSASVVS